MIFVLKFSNINLKGKYFARENQKINKIKESSKSVKSSMWFVSVTKGLFGNVVLIMLFKCYGNTCG